MALELRFDPNIQVTDTQEADRMGSRLFGWHLGLPVMGWEGRALTEDLNANGTNARTKVQSNRKFEKPDDRTYSNCDASSLNPKQNLKHSPTIVSISARNF